MQTEKTLNKERSSIDQEENNSRKKRVKKIGRRNKRVIPNHDISNEERTKNNNEIIQSETKVIDETDKKEKNKNIKKRKKVLDNNKSENESKSKKTKSVKIDLDKDEISFQEIFTY